MARRVPLDDPDTAIQVLRSDGGVILTGFCDASSVERVNQDARPYLDAIIREVLSQDEDSPFEANSVDPATTARETWLQQPAFLQILNHFLRTVTAPYNGDSSSRIGTDAILSASTTLEITPGVEAQTLHRDDFIWQHEHRAQSEGYEAGSDFGMGLLIPGVATTEGNGATLFIPKSHLWDDSRLPQVEEVRSAEMAVGEAFMFLASTVHAGGKNRTLESRPVHGFFFCRSWLRPEENQHMWFKKEEVEKWSLAARKQAGYILDNPFLGHCNETNPIDLFRSCEMDTMTKA
ncbi:MAG: hypothetical protein Q9219_001709 [cf. Caloplaca sp. 3 TL-2023]